MEESKRKGRRKERIGKKDGMKERRMEGRKGEERRI
jgi:hypothetical protein